MKKHLEYVFVLITAIVLTLYSPAAASGQPSPTATTQQPPNAEFDFRKVKWGMSRQEVIASEGAKPAGQQEGVTIYNVNILGLEGTLVFNFIDDKLVSAGYMFAVEHTNKNDFIDDFAKIDESLSNKYGKAQKTGPVWKNNLYRNEPQNFGLAVSIGHLAYLSIWNRSDTEITHFLSGDNFKIQHLLRYEGKSTRQLSKKKDQQQAEQSL